MNISETLDEAWIHVLNLLLMTAQVKTIAASISAIALTFAFSSLALAAAPDGAGPWADSVFNASQGTMKNGAAVPAPRSDTSSALGVAENDTVEGHFYSLGFGGSIALGFDNGISSGSMVVEATNLGYPGETAKVEMSENGTTWVTAGNISADGTVSKPEGITCAKYVRVTDTSDKANFSDDTADGFDVDGVKATGEPCTVPTPTPTCDPVKCCAGNTTVIQGNKTVATTIVNSSASTGGNKANNNTGGNVTVTSGNATSTVTTTVTGGNNVANIDGKGCCTGTSGKTNITISGNGAGSKNTVTIVNGTSKDKTLKKLGKK